MADQSQNDDSEIRVIRDKGVTVTESLTVEHQSGDGPDDRASARKFIEREAEMDLPDGLEIPNLIHDEDEQAAVQSVLSAIANARSSSDEE